jgi:transcription factor E
MRIELLKDVVYSIIGEKSKGIVDLLSVKKNVNEFIIAKKLSLTINQTRNLLYKLVDEGLVSVIRKKNKKKGGWYDHFWTLDLEKSLTKFRENMLRKINFLKQEAQIKKHARFYHCESCEVELNEEHALFQEYTCKECGQILNLKDNAKEIAALEKEIVKLEKELQEVESELALIAQKNAKSREKRIRFEEIRKAKEKKMKRNARDLAKKKLLKVSKKKKKKHQKDKKFKKSSKK